MGEGATRGRETPFAMLTPILVFLDGHPLDLPATAVSVKNTLVNRPGVNVARLTTLGAGMTKQTDAFVDRCLDDPKEPAMKAMQQVKS